MTERTIPILNPNNPYIIIAMARTSSTILNKSGERVQYFLMPDLIGNTLIFLTEYNVYHGLVYGLDYIESNC